MRILITGSRDWPSDRTVEDVLFMFIAEQLDSGRLPYDETVSIVQGGAGGADREAKDVGDLWQKIGGPVEVETYPADWTAHGKAAGFKRNALMVDLGADVCIAFIGPCRKHPDQDHPSHGAMDTIDRCLKVGIEVEAWEYHY